MNAFVVRRFFEDAPETDYLGVYADFFKAVSACARSVRYEYDNAPEYALGIHPVTSATDSEVWTEIFYNGKPYGTYYTITKMEIE